MRDLFVALSVPGTQENATAVIAQIQAEGGFALFNPLNCTVKAKGSSDYNPPPIHVQNYVSYEQGLQVTKGMLKQANMKPLLDALRKGDSALAYWSHLPGSWGTSPPHGYSHEAWLADTRSHWYARAMIAVTGT